MKHVYCAECGEKLEVLQRAVPSQQRIYPIVRPHNCRNGVEVNLSEKGIEEKIIEESKKESPSVLDDLFDKFKFVKKLNNLKPSKPSPLDLETGDRRSKKDLREELVVSTAPLTVRDNLNTSPHATPEGDISEEPNE